PYRSLTFSLSRRGGPLCPPDHTRRITSATRGVASSCTSKSAIPYELLRRYPDSPEARRWPWSEPPSIA
ncbi:MAG: hypothetical protein C0P73_002240, partial [Rhodothermus marinus]